SPHRPRADPPWLGSLLVNPRPEAPVSSLARPWPVPKMPPMHQTPKSALVLAGLAGLIASGCGAIAQSTIQPADSKPYDDRLMRLSEVLGAVHYLRELCGANDGQHWRDRMKEIMDAEGTSALRRAKLTRSFNNGYRSYSRTYNSCTPSAQTAIVRFLA